MQVLPPDSCGKSGEGEKPGGERGIFLFLYSSDMDRNYIVELFCDASLLLEY